MDNEIIFVSFDDQIPLATDDTTDSAIISVSGYAIAGSTVRVYDGEILLGTFTAKKASRYAGIVTLSGGYGSH